jgi:hypothetical protein
VSQGGLTQSVYLYDTVAAAPVAGSTLSTSSTTDVRQITANIAGALLAGRIYQFRAECLGGALPSDFGVVRSAALKG